MLYMKQYNNIVLLKGRLQHFKDVYYKLYSNHYNNSIKSYIANKPTKDIKGVIQKNTQLIQKKKRGEQNRWDN